MAKIKRVVFYHSLYFCLIKEKFAVQQIHFPKKHTNFFGKEPSPTYNHWLQVDKMGLPNDSTKCWHNKSS